MSLLLADGGDWAADSTSAKARWTDVSTAITVSATGSHYSTQNYILSGSAASALTAPAVGSWSGTANILWQGWIKIAVNAAFTAGSNVILLNLLNGGTSAAQIKYDPFTNTLQLIGTGGAQQGTNDTGGSLNDGAWHFIEWKILLATTTTGTSEFRIDGVARSNLTVAANAFNQAAATTLNYGSNHRTATEYFNLHIDDTIVWNWSSGQVTTFTGKRRILTFRPTSDSVVTWTPDTGATNYTQVNKTQYSLTHNLQTLTLNNQDLYGQGSFAAYGFNPATIHAVQPGVVGILVSGTSANVASVLKSASTTDIGANITMSATPTYIGKVYETDPATSASWLKAAIDACTFGEKLTGTTTSGKAELGIVYLEVVTSDAAGSTATTDVITQGGYTLTRNTIVNGVSNLIGTKSLALAFSSVKQQTREPVTTRTYSIVVEKVGEAWRDHISPDYITRWDPTHAKTKGVEDANLTDADQLLSPQLRRGQPTYVLKFFPFLERNTVADRVASGSPNARWWKKLLNN